MAEFVSLKKSPDLKADSGPCCDDNEYGWGTQLRFEDEIARRLGLDKVPLEGRVQITAIGFVTGMSSDHERDGRKISVSIQLTDAAVQPLGPDMSAAESLYGGGQG